MFYRFFILLLISGVLMSASLLPKYQEKVLENGLKVVVIPLEGKSGVISTQVVYKVGSKDEVMGKSGIAHMLEHLNFKSTKNLKAGEFDEIVKSFGGINNASTSFDWTKYYINASSDNLEKTLELFSELMSNQLLLDDSNEKVSWNAKDHTIVLSYASGDDGIGVYIVEDEVLFAGDVWMPIPHIVDGDSDTMKESLRKIKSLTIENVVQGHGEVILRGEVYSSIDDRIAYLDTIQKIVDEAAEDDFPGEYLKEKTIEICGKSRILLGGAAEEIHQQNLRHLYRKNFGNEPQGLDH